MKCPWCGGRVQLVDSTFTGAAFEIELECLECEREFYIRMTPEKLISEFLRIEKVEEKREVKEESEEA